MNPKSNFIDLSIQVLINYLSLLNPFLDECNGDSGAPLWITKTEKDTDHNILVAVNAGYYETQKYFQPPCTSVAGRAHKITDKVLKWIRKNMERYDN